jgi:hypothetical protein
MKANVKAGMLTEERRRCSGSCTNGYEGEGSWKTRSSAISMEPSYGPLQAPACGASEKGQGNTLYASPLAKRVQVPGQMHGKY